MPEKPRVLNRYKDQAVPNSVYIGRPTKWGNPFAISPRCTREQAIEKYKEWILTQPKLMEAAKMELKGKNLVCFCAPLPCHGDVLLSIANSDGDL